MENTNIQLKNWWDMPEAEKTTLFKKFLGGRVSQIERSKIKSNRQRRWLIAQRKYLDPSIKRDYGTICPLCGYKKVYLLKEIRKCKGCDMEFSLLGNRLDFVEVKE